MNKLKLGNYAICPMCKKKKVRIDPHLLARLQNSSTHLLCGGCNKYFLAENVILKYSNIKDYAKEALERLHGKV